MSMRGKGLSRAEAFEVLVEGGYDKQISTLHKHVARIKSTGYVFLPVKSAGAKSALNDDQKQNLVSFIESQNRKFQPVDLEDVQAYIFDSFEVEVCKATCCNYLRELNMSRKTCQSKSGGFRLINSELQAMYWGFILEMRESYKLCVRPFLIRSIDVTTTKCPSQSKLRFRPSDPAK